MRINFYFEFPCLDPDADNVHYLNSSVHLMAFVKLYKRFKLKYPNIEFKAVNSWNKLYNGKDGGLINTTFLYSYFFLIIENPDTNKHIVVSYWDKLRALTEGAFWDLANCVEILAATGVQDNEVNYRPTRINYTPISLTSLHYQTEVRINQVYSQPKVQPERLFFRGGHYDIREYLAQDKRFTVTNQRVAAEAFVDEIAKWSFNIDINGAAEISCRSIDIMGLQSALIRPKLGIQYHNALIPDYHYAALKCDDLGNWKDVADAYVERFEDLKKDPDLVEFIARNGRKWYEENGTLESHINILDKLINLDKLCI